MRKSVCSTWVFSSPCARTGFAAVRTVSHDSTVGENFLEGLGPENAVPIDHVVFQGIADRVDPLAVALQPKPTGAACFDTSTTATQAWKDVYKPAHIVDTNIEKESRHEYNSGMRLLEALPSVSHAWKEGLTENNFRVAHEQYSVFVCHLEKTSGENTPTILR